MCGHNLLEPEMTSGSPRIDARRGDPSYKLAHQALTAFPTYR